MTFLCDIDFHNFIVLRRLLVLFVLLISISLFKEIKDDFGFMFIILETFEIHLKRKQ